MRRSMVFRRVAGLLSLVIIAVAIAYTVPEQAGKSVIPDALATTYGPQTAGEALARLEVKGRAPKTGYERDQFGNGWAESNGCDTRNMILRRDMTDVTLDAVSQCKVLRGTLLDPYTGKTITFTRGTSTSDDVQIDHVVALSNSWQTGAQLFDEAKRKALANDPLELLAVDGPANQQKSDGDAATWLPSNKGIRCYYVARQIAVKTKYGLWVTPAEKDAMNGVVAGCPDQKLPQ
jgi:hypothetical protein